MNTQPHTASSPGLPLRGQALSDSGLTLGRQRRPRPYPARISTEKPFQITDGIRSRHLRPQEAELLFALMNERRISAGDAIELLWPTPDDEPEWAAESLRVYCCRIRRALEPFGWTIRSVWHFGYSLERAACQSLTERRRTNSQDVN